MTHSQRRVILEFCRSMRTDSTDAEHKLWMRLRNRRLLGAKFRRQHPVGQYIVDFYCHEAKLAVELDGSVHDHPDQAAYDRNRSEDLHSMGIRVIRFRNHEVRQNIDQVLHAIKEALSEANRHHENE